MFTPHSVTVYNVVSEGQTCVTFLDGVFLDTSAGRIMEKNGAAPDDQAALYIPFNCNAVNALTGQVQHYCPPKVYDQCHKRDGVWTIAPGNRRSGVDCFFIKGRVVEPDSDFAGLNDRRDDVFRVSSVAARDFGTPGMRHWQVGGK